MCLCYIISLLLEDVITNSKNTAHTFIQIGGFLGIFERVALEASRVNIKSSVYIYHLRGVFGAILGHDLKY